jgi:LacI family transcriptional regulator, galactose operon repressor
MLVCLQGSAISPFNVRCRVETIKSFNPELLARRLWHYRDKVDGIAFMALEHPAVREAVNRSSRKIRRMR